MKKLLPFVLLALANCANAQVKEECLSAFGTVRQASVSADESSTVKLAFTDGQEVVLTGPDTVNVWDDLVRGLTLVGIQDDSGKYRIVYQAGFCAAYSQFQANNT